jgi:arginyl-tRNA synthetase
MDLSLVEFERIYQALGIRFDYMQGESFYQDRMAEVRELLKEKNLLMTSDGAQVVSLEDEGRPPCLVVKSDGASTYATRDLAAAIYRKRTYGFDSCLYVVGNPQALHFQQVFSVLGRMGMAWHAACHLVGFGLVRFADRKLSTRTGDVVFLEDVLEEAVKRCAAKMKERDAGTEAGDRDETARMVGIGAVVFAFLKNGRDRDIVFSWEDTLDFDGDSGPYVQYTHARAASVLRKLADGDARSVRERQENSGVFEVGEGQADIPVQTADAGLPLQSVKSEAPLTHDLEFQLAKHLDGFKQAVRDAADKNEPCLVARQVALIARTFNRFYAACPIRSASVDIRKSRLRLTASVCQVLKTGMGLLGIGVPESM